MQRSKNNYAKAKDVLFTNARRIERHWFQFHFENDGSEDISHASYAYHNVTGGFGPGMEPDTPSPGSISYPLFSKETVTGNLSELINRRKEDGKWDTLYVLSKGMQLEWPRIPTLWTLLVLKNSNSLRKQRYGSKASR